ncbi:ZN282 protein, partial [Mohoua ochrocephala]|nr:ZN282 protein [Mohoua ochrocephala]
KSYICSDCGKNFVCHSWLVRHQTSHTGERPYKCSKCDKTYRRKDYLLNHQRRHTGERLFQCPLCSKSFARHAYLLRHQRAHAAPPRPHACAECGRRFLEKPALDSHLR